MSVMWIHTSLPLDDLYITSTLPLEIEEKIRDFGLQICKAQIRRGDFSLARTIPKMWGEERYYSTQKKRGSIKGDPRVFAG